MTEQNSQGQNSTEAAQRSSAIRYWNQVLDPQNLERAGSHESSTPRLTLEDEIAFARTPDLAVARDWLIGASPRPAWIMDLGAGLGANSFALARHDDPGHDARPGERLLAVDTSLARLCALRDRARAASVAERIGLVVAAAEALPFAGGTVPAIYTKSVLIHTALPRAAAELARVLAPGGRAALVEPQPGNPFVRLYRATLAPRAWRAITRYFDPQAQAIFCQAPGMRAPRPAIQAFYFISFFAFAFQFGWPCQPLFRLSLAPLHALDRLLFRLLPPLRRWAWFGLICLEKSDSRAGGPESTQ